MVKADRALTLFMINTLAENARKYTPEGGTIKVYARITEEMCIRDRAGERIQNKGRHQ